jgi:hypothetical protein
VYQANDDVLFVASEFIESDTKGKYLQVGKLSNKVYVEIGLQGDERTEVSGEIKEGDKIYD